MSASVKCCISETCSTCQNEVSSLSLILYFNIQFEQMDLEIRSLPTEEKTKYHTRLQSYRNQVETLQRDLVIRYNELFFCEAYTIVNE